MKPPFSSENIQPWRPGRISQKCFNVFFLFLNLKLFLEGIVVLLLRYTENFNQNILVVIFFCRKILIIS